MKINLAIHCQSQDECKECFTLHFENKLPHYVRFELPSLLYQQTMLLSWRSKYYYRHSEAIAFAYCNSYRIKMIESSSSFCVPSWRCSLTIALLFASMVFTYIVFTNTTTSSSNLFRITTKFLHVDGIAWLPLTKGFEYGQKGGHEIESPAELKYWWIEHTKCFYYSLAHCFDIMNDSSCWVR